MLRLLTVTAYRIAMVRGTLASRAPVKICSGILNGRRIDVGTSTGAMGAGAFAGGKLKRLESGVERSSWKWSAMTAVYESCLRFGW